MAFDRGPLNVYEITWTSGHVERVTAHSVVHPNSNSGWMTGKVPEQPQIRVYAEIDGHWTLVLAAREEDIRTIRLVTADEPIPGER